MKNTFFSALVTLFLGLTPLSHAMTLERVNNDLYATGPTVDQDFLSFKDAFAKGGIKRLILVNAPGGDLWTGMRVARMVQDAKIKTVASGLCMSACSLIFMAGQERSFGTGHLPRMTMIGIHGAHDLDSKKVLSQAMPQMYALYKQQMGEKFDAAVINQALYDIKEASGFLRVREMQRTQEKDRTPWFCPTGQTPLDQCQQHSGKDAYSLGVVTQTETVALQLPDSMQIKLGFFGRPLNAPPVDFQDRADQLIDSLCQGQLLCKTIGGRTFKNYLSAHQNKALAIGRGKTGYGIRWGDDDPGVAMLRALYHCNHAKNNPKLCRLVAVNDHELLPLYDEEPSQSNALIETLKAPPPALSQAERDEPGGPSPSRLRTGNHVTGMTPKMLEGIQRWDTATLVQALKQNERPVVIDAAAFGPVIPSALNLIHSGLAFEDAQQESAYAERFRQMLLAAAPNLNQPVVFYCASSACWLSVNAAMRARQLGYTQVIWYRGGMAAWTQAGLPTVGRVPVAVLH
ncbi:MAG: ATP-dependent Clp protease proteolytic subunit [Limnohabitans sp.]|nr:ATP-dependent Clp protease proteolytic subunit [Limnohabitans sp.]